MTSQTTHSLLETLYVPLDENHTYSYTKLPVLYMHVGCFFFLFFFLPPLLFFIHAIALVWNILSTVLCLTN